MRMIFALLPLATALLPATASSRPPALDDLHRIRAVSEAQISPDGEWVAYTVTAPHRELDEDTSDLWMSNWQGDVSLQLTRTPKSEHHPRWSPDGQALAFLSDRGKEKEGEQVWLLDMRGGEARQITTVADGVSDFAWSPDGKEIVLVAEVAEEKDPAGKPQPIVVDRLYFKEDITGYLGTTRSHLFLLDVESGSVEALTEGDYDELQPSWSPDGSRIAFVTKRGDDMDRDDNWDIYVVDAEPGAEATQLTRNAGSDGDADGSWGSGPPDWSADGENIAYLHGGAEEDIWYGLLQVGTVAIDGDGASLPTEALDRNTVGPRWSPDGRSIYFRLEDDQGIQLAEVRLRDGRVERLTGPEQVVYEFDFNEAGRTVLVLSSSTRPAEVYKLERGKLEQLSRQNDAWLKEVDLSPAETIRFNSADDVEIHGMVVWPATRSATSPLPLILRIHGGPVSQYQHEFDFEWQLFAASGYVVAGVNPRGSSGRGHAFQKMLFADWGFADVPDINAAVDHLIEAGLADPERLGVGGWSYGGILTNYMIASTKRFKAAISGAGMSNMLGGYGIDQYVRAWELELGRPWENTEAWLRLSYPFLEAERISTPTLFMCGAADFNVPLTASEQMYQALKSLGVPTELIIYPDQYHSLTRVSFQRDKLERYLEWYDRYLK
ncbi:MAG TPA: S9 family peptidase [Woeseiaceae bacterium]|nr:S9 family peptidase [Woeseiaceae bacterium]